MSEPKRSSVIVVQGGSIGLSARFFRLTTMRQMRLMTKTEAKFAPFDPG